MGDTEVSSDVSTVRERQYGAAWRLTNSVMLLVMEHVGDAAIFKMLQAEVFHCWYLILTKLIRLLWSPTLDDSWVDISNYALMARTVIKDENQ